MVEYHLTTPISEEDARKLKVGDVVYVTGEHVYTARDEAHERALHMFEKGEKPPVDFEGSGRLFRLVLQQASEWSYLKTSSFESTRLESS
jgi:tartrate dehydratase beta subunit/fumarate hydratase class I family protein